MFRANGWILKSITLLPVLFLFACGGGGGGDDESGCSTGDLRCSASVAERCTDGQWAAVSDCSSDGKVCKDGACVDAPQTDGDTTDGDAIDGDEDVIVECEENETDCDDSWRRICDEGEWKREEDCSVSGGSCEDGTCIPSEDGDVDMDEDLTEPEPEIEPEIEPEEDLEPDAEEEEGEIEWEWDAVVCGCEDNECCVDGCSLPNGTECTDDTLNCTFDYCVNGECLHPAVPKDCSDVECGRSRDGCYECFECEEGLACFNHFCLVPGGGSCGERSGWAADGSWSMTGFCPSHQGRSSLSGSLSSDAGWNFGTNPYASNPPVVALDGTAYRGSNVKRLYAITSSAEKLWEFPLDSNSVGSPAISQDKSVVIGTTGGQVYAVRSYGTRKWRYQAGGAVVASPTIGSDGKIYICTNEPKLYALNSDGTESWTLDLEAECNDPAVAPDGTIYITTRDGNLHSVSSGGSIGWTYPAPASIHSPPSIGISGTIYFGCDDSKLYAVYSTGELFWTFETNGSITAIPAIGNEGWLYFGNANSKFYAVDQGGLERWRKTVDGAIYGNAAIGSTGYVYFGTKNGTVYALSEQTGDEKWSRSIGTGISTHVTIAPNAMIYTTGDNGKLYATGKKRPESAFVPITPGTFMEGSPAEELGRSNSEVQRQVTLTIPYEIQNIEVTQGEFVSLLGYNSSNVPECGSLCPANNVSWHEAAHFTNALSLDNGLPQCFDCTGENADVECELKPEFAKPQDCTGYRLPTYAEWEFAARAGTTTSLYNGELTAIGLDPDPLLGQIAWYLLDRGMLTDVGVLEPNAWGLYDMIGNVQEFVYDDRSGNRNSNPVTDPAYTETIYLKWKMLRGGAYDEQGEKCRSAAFEWFLDDVRDPRFGFRVARTISAR